MSNDIEQTVENTRFIFTSTDMTAIYSFVVAAVIGLIIALIGCFLAWWYGKKSFDLTTQSFNITIQQIQASVDSAKENVDKSFQMNQNLISSQQIIHKKELDFRYHEEWIQNFDDLMSDYFGEVMSYVTMINQFVIHHELSRFNLDVQNEKEIFELIAKKVEKISKIKFKILLLLGNKFELELHIIDDLEFMDQWIRGEYVTNCFANKTPIELKGSEYKKFMFRASQCKNSIIELRYCKVNDQLGNKIN